MAVKKHNQHGFNLVGVLVALAVIGIVGFVGFKVLQQDKKATNSEQAGGTSQTNSKPVTQAASFVEWSFDGNNWDAMGTAPACENPLSIASPIDVTKATALLYPGQVRGGDFKPHGGLALDGAPNNEVAVYAIRNAYMYQGSRYIEGGEIQYMLDFMDSCGIRYRYDHIATPKDDVMKYINELPEAKTDDSRTNRFSSPKLFKTGEVIATAVGHAKTSNYGFDLGVYDLRAPNAASKTDIYKTDKLRIEDKEQSFYSVCWFDLLPAKDKAAVKALPPRGGAKEATSDYCKI